MWAPHVHALTLGEPSWVASAGQPQGIELPLRDLGTLELNQLKARLAPDQAWALAGLKPIESNRIEFSFQRSVSGPVLVIQTTAWPEAAWLNLLIELQWPNGRLQREVGLPMRAQPDGKGPFVAVPAALWVQEGDTAGALAQGHLGDVGTRDQVWQAMVLANPQAFVDGNINRLKAGVALRWPDAAQIKAMDPEQARESIARQMQAFAAYRSEMAAQATAAVTEQAPQVATGKVQPRDKTASEAAGDRLSLSTAGSDDSDQIAAKRQAQQTADRAAELNRNIQELNRLAQGGEPAGVPLPSPATAPENHPAPSEWIRQWSSHPMAPWVALSAVLALLGWSVWRGVRRPKHQDADPSSETLNPLEQHWKPDFDLDLPAADALQPLPEVSQAPTAVQRRNAPTQDPPPSLAVGTPLAGLSLDLDTTPELDQGDPHEVRWALAQALWHQGQTQTARVLAREVMNTAPAPLAQAARQWLDQRA